jgi:MFS family permease
MKTIFAQRNIQVLIIAQVLSAISFRLWMPYFSLYALELGATKELVGVIAMIQAIGVLISQIPGGVLADRIGRKMTIILFTLFEIFTPLLYFFATSWPQLLLGAISQSISWACMPALNALVIESIPRDIRGTGIGVYRFVTWLPRMVMEFMGGVMLDTWGTVVGMNRIFLWSIIASLLILIVRYYELTETWHAQQSKKEPIGAHTQSLTLRVVLKQIWPLMLVGGLASFAARMAMPFLVVYAVEEIGLTKSAWGLITMITGLVSISLNTFGGMLSDRVGRKPGILASRVGEPLSILGLTVSENMQTTLATQLLKGVGNGLGGGLVMKGLMMGGPVWHALVADIVPIEQRGRMMGLLGSAQILLALPSSWIGGYLWDTFNPAMTLQTSSIIGFAAAIIFLFFVPEPKNQLREASKKY